MKNRITIILVIASQLLALEMFLEYRAYSRGWDTLMLGKGENVSNAQETQEERYGPNQFFPFRSRIVESRLSDTTVFWIASSSMGFHEQLPANNIFPNRFHILLEERSLKGTVINASRNGNSIKDNSNSLMAGAPKWRPDYAILYNMSNDINRMSRIRYGPKGENVPHGAHLMWALPFLEDTTTYTLTKKILSSNLAQRRILRDGLGEEGDKEFESLIINFVQQSRQLGVEPVLCTFATSHKMESFDQWPLAVKSFLFSYNIYLSPKGWATTIDGFNDIIREVAQREKVGLIDAYKELAGNKEYFVDFVHFSPFGHEKLGRIFADYFENILASHQRN